MRTPGQSRTAVQVFAGPAASEEPSTGSSHDATPFQMIESLTCWSTIVCNVMAHWSWSTLLSSSGALKGVSLMTVSSRVSSWWNLLLVLLRLLPVLILTELISHSADMLSWQR